MPNFTSSPRTLKRNRSERIFRAICQSAIALTALFLVFLISNLAINAIPSLTQYVVRLSLVVDPAKVDATQIAAGDFQAIVRTAIAAEFPDVTAKPEKKKLVKLFSTSIAENLQRQVTADPSLIGKTITVEGPLAADADSFLKGQQMSVSALGENSDFEARALAKLKEAGKLTREFSWSLLTNGDSRSPEKAGLRGAFMGSLFTIAITLLVALPLGVAAALYLEEFARQSRLRDLIEVNINNLAAVPSIIFGLLGLAVFVNKFGLPRSSPLVGGLVLALLVLPTIIIASRAALRSVPPSIREAALGVGASHQQSVFHHVLPLAVPGILTGTILGVARALGETAPLLMIGMVAFIADVPTRITDAATALPVQVYLWSALPEAAFRSRTSVAILALLIVLFVFNALAIWLRNRFERRW
ncbi:MAG: phosphate ABC transporter permease PstA [Alphaproteobacteria bacterium]|nr:phosphate ABC transporter permease PstA [Alphaproteobacteria bacterium]